MEIAGIVLLAVVLILIAQAANMSDSRYLWVAGAVILVALVSVGLVAEPVTAA